MRKRSISLIVLLLAIHILGMDEMPQLNGIKLLLGCGCIESVSVTPTNMIVRTCSSEDIARWWGVEPNAEIILTPEKETVFAEWHGGVTLSPVSFKNKQKGFRVKTNSRNREGEIIFYIAYIALGDTPAEMGEDDVEMVMDRGEWVTAEVARKRLEQVKLGPRASMLIEMADEIMRNPERMAEVRKDPWMEAEWNELIEKGLIKTNAVEKKGGATVGGAKPSPASREQKLGNGNEQSGIEEEGQPRPHRLWRYAVIPLGLLAVLYFIRRKSKN
ncbi:MAG: hypothetical protein FWH21_05850 [Kiritimatiellaeota bacterium]|nr:hypothetical protein [Kiritimatiellota bacterium]